MITDPHWLLILGAAAAAVAAVITTVVVVSANRRLVTRTATPAEEQALRDGLRRAAAMPQPAPVAEPVAEPALDAESHVLVACTTQTWCVAPHPARPYRNTYRVHATEPVVIGRGDRQVVVCARQLQHGDGQPESVRVAVGIRPGGECAQISRFAAEVFAAVMVDSTDPVTRDIGRALADTVEVTR